MDDSLPELGDLEREVMQLVWANGPVTAEAVRERLSRPLKESTVRTVLRRLEDKGYTTHTVDGRTYVYQAAEPRGRVAAKAVQRIVDWFCNGSVEEVLVGMVDTAMLDQRKLRMLADQVAKARAKGREEEMMLAILAESALRSLVLGSVVWVGLNLLARAKSARAYDILGHGAGGVVVDAAADALDHGDRHAGRLAGAVAGNTCGPPAIHCRSVPEPLPPALPPDPGMPAAGMAASHGRQLAGGGDGDLRACCRPAAAEIGGRLLSDLASGPRREADERTLDGRLERAREQRHRRARHVRIDHPAAASVLRLGFARSARPCSPMRAPTSPTAISMCCCSPRSIVRCSGSVRSRGGTSIRLAELAEIISDARALEVVEDRLSYARDSARSRAARPAGAGGAGNGEGVHGTRPRRAHSRGHRSPAKLGLAQAAVDRGGHRAGRHRFCRQHRLPHAPSASAPAIDRAADATAARAGRSLLTSIRWTELDLRRFSRGRRSFRATERATKTPTGRGAVTGPSPTRRRRARSRWPLGGEQQPSELMLSQNGRDMRAARIAELSRQVSRPMPRTLDSYVGWYQLSPSRVLTVTRDGERLYCPGDRTAEIRGHGPWRRCICRQHDDLVIFLRDDQAKVTQLLLQDPISGARLAPRIDRRQGKGDRGGICAADCRSPGSIQGTDPAAGQQGGDPARDRGPAARRAEL